MPPSALGGKSSLETWLTREERGGKRKEKKWRERSQVDRGSRRGKERNKAERRKKERKKEGDDDDWGGEEKASIWLLEGKEEKKPREQSETFIVSRRHA